MHTPPLLTHLERVAAAVILRFAATRLVERIDRRTREWNVAGSIERPAVPARLEKKRSGNAPIPRDSLYETPAPPALDRTRARAVRLPGVPRPGKPSRATAGLTGCAERTPTGAARVASVALRAFSASSTKPPAAPAMSSPGASGSERLASRCFGVGVPLGAGSRFGGFADGLGGTDESRAIASGTSGRRRNALGYRLVVQPAVGV